jgi:hypothetical protein
MGLKTFHMIFVTVCILLSGYFAFWSYSRYSEDGSDGDLIMSILSLIVTIAFIIYGIKVQKKYKS